MTQAFTGILRMGIVAPVSRLQGMAARPVIMRAAA